MTWKLTYRHKIPNFYELGHPKFSIDEYIEFFLMVGISVISYSTV